MVISCCSRLIGGQDPLAAIAEKVIGLIPPFDHVQACLHLVAQLDGRQILTEVDRLRDFAQLGQGLIGGMRHVIGVEALEDRLGRGCARLEGHRMLDHLIVLLGNEVPANRAAQDTRQVGEGPRHALVGQVEPFVFDPLEAGHQAHATQQVTERKGDLGLAMESTKFFSTRISVSWRIKPSIIAATSENEKFRSCE